MNTRSQAAAAAALIAVCVVPMGAARTLDYPSRPIRVVVPFTAGSATDILARLIGPKLLESWGQQVVIDNRPSAGGTVAGVIVAGASPDGHTLMLTSSGFAGTAALYTKLPYDTLKDFTGITQIASTPLPGFEYDGWYGLVAPARTPRTINNALSAEVGRILQLPDIKERIASQGATPKPTTPEQFDQLVREEIVMRGKVFKASGARPD